MTIVHQVFLRLCSLHLAHDARVLIITLVSCRHVYAPLWCDCLYFVSCRRLFRYRFIMTHLWT